MPFRFDLPSGSRFEKLDKNKHDRASFCCGVEPLDTFLKTLASQAQERNESTTHVVCSPNPGNDGLHAIQGFVTLTPSDILVAEAPPALKCKDGRVHCQLIARMGVAEHCQNTGMGTILMSHALRFCLTIAEISAFRLVVVDAKNEKLVKFYERFGFSALPENKLRLLLSVKTLKKSLAPFPSSLATAK